MNYLFFILAGLILFCVIGIIKKPGSVFRNKPEQQNPMEGKKVVFVENPEEPVNADGVSGHLEAVGDAKIRGGFYNRVIKRMLDIFLSFFGLALLSPVFFIISLWIIIDDPGPILFTQKRIGRNKQYFIEHKRLTTYNSLCYKGLKVA